MFTKRNSSTQKKVHPKISTASPKILKDKNNGYVNSNKKTKVTRKTSNLTQINSYQLFLSNVQENKNETNHCSIRHTLTHNEMIPFRLGPSVLTNHEINSATITRNNVNFNTTNTDYTLSETERSSISNAANSLREFTPTLISSISNKKRQSKNGLNKELPITLNKFPISIEKEPKIIKDSTIDYNILRKATDKLNNLLLKKKEEKSRHVSYDRHIIQIATNKLQNIFENNNNKKNDSISSKSLSKSKRKKKRMKSANKYYSILNQQNTLDKILRLETILSNKKSKDSSTTITTISQINKTYDMNYILSLKQLPICNASFNLPKPLLTHFTKFKIFEDESNKNVLKRKDYSSEVKQAEEFKLKLEEKRKLDPIKHDLTELLNMLTVDNYNEIFNIVYDTIYNDVDNQNKFLEVLFQKAINEKAFVFLYAKLCKDLDKELPQRLEQTKKKSISTSLMRSKLVEKCKEIFSIEHTSQVNYYIKVKDPEEREFKTKKFVLGNVNFIGELISMKLLTKKIWFNCILDLFSRYENKEENDKLKLIFLEGIILFTDKFGTLINNQKSKIKKDIIKEYESQINITLNKLEQIKKNDKLPGHVKYKIINLVEKKKGGWEETKFEKNSIAKGKDNLKKEFNDFLID
jgi:hypothetical protein